MAEAQVVVGNISEEEMTGYGDSECAGNGGKHPRPMVMVQATEMRKWERAEMREVEVQSAMP